MIDPTAINSEVQRIFEVMRSGRWTETEAACRELIKVAPGIATVWFYLGMAIWNRRALAEAEAAFRQALALDAEPAMYWSIFGTLLREQGRWQDVAWACREAVHRNPSDSGSWSNLGLAEFLLGRLADAQHAYEQSLSLTPERLDVQTEYASLLCRRAAPEKAVAVLRAVLAQSPQMAAAWKQLGNALGQLGEYQQAIEAYRQALALAPEDRDARHNLAVTLYQNWSLPEAEALARQLTLEQPNWANAWSLLGLVLQRMGRPGDAIPVLRRSVDLTPNPELHSRLLVAMQYLDGVNPEQLLAAHRQWEAAYAQPTHPAAPRTHGRDRPLRLGFVSDDLAEHPIAFLLLGALEALDKSRRTVVCYSGRTNEDEFTARFRAASDTWRPTVGLSPAELAETIRRDEIDILLDLMGHTGNHLLTFALRPAPVQISWLGYVGTTGLSAIDYLLADRFHVRLGEEGLYAEQVLRMPNGYACYQPPRQTPDVSVLPAIAAGQVTFGCFNNPAKFGPQIMDAWSAILNRVPNSRLLLKFSGLSDEQAQQRLREPFVRRNVTPERVVIEGRSPHYDLLASYGRVDLALDTQPYSGGVTTCEALWMGVPVITFPGKTFAGRHATSHLMNAGYPQFVAADTDGYVGLAVQWANRLEELAEIRAGMREHVRQSPLCDAERFATDFLAILVSQCREKSTMTGCPLPSKR